MKCRNRGRVYQSSGRWAIDYKDLSGRRVRKLTDAQGEEEAQAILNAKLSANVRAELLGLPSGDAVDMTFGQFVSTIYLPHVKVTRRPGTYQAYCGIAEHILPRLGHVLLRGITRQMILGYLDDRTSKGRKFRGGKGLSPSTINREAAFIKSSLYDALSREIIGRNPAARIKMRKEENERKRIMTPVEEALILRELDATGNGWVCDAIKVSVLSGLRRGELIRLNYGDIDLDSPKPMIHVSAEAKGGEPREVPVTPDLHPILKRLMEGVQERCKALPSALRNEPLFVLPPTSDRPNTMHIQGRFERVVERVGIMDLHWHDLRRTFASRLANLGVSLQTIAKLLGHSATYVTERYSWMQPETLQDAVNLLSKGQKGGESVKNLAPGTLERIAVNR